MGTTSEFYFFLACAIIVLLIPSVFSDNITSSDGRSKRQSRQVCESDTCRQIAQRILSGIDRNVDPCKDFYEHSCGSWMRKNTIPEDKTWWSPWSIARVKLKNQIKKMLEMPYDAQQHAVPVAKQALNLYKGCMNQEMREKVGLSPLKGILKKINGWPMIEKAWDSRNYSWENAFVYLKSRFGLNYIMSMYVDVDSKNTTRRLIYFDRPGLGLGRSELQNPRESKETEKLVNAYYKYIKSSAKLLNGQNIPEKVIRKDIIDMLRFESKLARLSLESADRRDHFGLYNKMTIKQLQQRFPGIKWFSIIRRIFRYARVPIYESDEVILQDTSYYKNLAPLLSNTPKRTIANYIGWRSVLSFSDYTTKNFTDTYFEYQKVAYGQRKPEKQWELCYTVLDSYFQYVMGRLYVDNYFDGSSKSSVDRLVKEIKGAFADELGRHDWMDTTTLSKSREKLNEMLANVAYQTWIKNDTELERSYKGVREIDPENFFGAIVNLDKWQMVKKLRKLRKKVDRKFSRLSGPAIVNAFNYFDLNYIQFPAGILQPPFYSFRGPAAVNFGAIGKTIGHEIIHGFDDEGKQYDKEGNLKDWWTQETEEEYNDKAECFVNQYEKFKEPITGLFVNGVDTQGENLADNGGVRMAYKVSMTTSSRSNQQCSQAYRNFVDKYGDQYDPLLPGEMSRYTSDQLFFLSFASIWCENERKESMRNTIRYGSHSPSRFRVVGSVINLKEFSKAFRCPAGSKMNPKKKCMLW